MVTDIPDLFPTSYEQSRKSFIHSLDQIRARWSNARRYEYPLSNFVDLSIDWIRADALESAEKLLVFTTGEHGIEGYVGSAMLQRFMEFFT